MKLFEFHVIEGFQIPIKSGIVQITIAMDLYSNKLIIILFIQSIELKIFFNRDISGHAMN